MILRTALAESAAKSPSPLWGGEPFPPREDAF